MLDWFVWSRTDYLHENEFGVKWPTKVDVPSNPTNQSINQSSVYLVSLNVGNSVFSNIQISCIWSINKKKVIEILFKISYYFKKEEYLLFGLLFSSFCFKDYTIQMLALCSNRLLKPHSEVLQLSSCHSLWYFCYFMTDKIFQLVSCLQPTYKVLGLQVSPEELFWWIS